MTKGCQVDYDLVIVGSGPAGVSAAFPLVEAGLRVLMVDGGLRPHLAPPAGQFLDARRHDGGQWRWMIGQHFHALRQSDAVSPKLRVPTHAAVFEGFQETNRIVSDEFIAVGSLAVGGLSNAWGCGVATLTDNELATFPVKPSEMRTSYRDVARRIGVSGGCDDDLSNYFGLDEWSQGPVFIDEMQGGLLARYQGCRGPLNQKGFRLGRARLAVITAPTAGRKACDRSGSCLWGCERRALYSATDDLRLLHNWPKFHYRSGFVVGRVVAQGDCVLVERWGSDATEVVKAKRVLLAAGTLASTRLALRAIDHRSPVSMQSCPTAAFMLWLPRHLGRAHDAVFGLGQLSFTLDLAGGTQAFGSLFSTTGIPVAEFARHMPFGKRYGVDLLQPLLSSCVVGNLFLPGAMTDVSLRLDAKDRLVIQGMYRNDVVSLMDQSRRMLRNSFWQMGALLMPSSFKVGRPGSDIHYAASLPMRVNPVLGQTDKFGELAGVLGIHVVDGASLSSLPAKSHTLTIMANADRIAKHMANIMVPTGM